MRNLFYCTHCEQFWLTRPEIAENGCQTCGSPVKLEAIDVERLEALTAEERKAFLSRYRAKRSASDALDEAVPKTVSA